MYSINKQHIERLMEGLATFGSECGQGITRLAYSEADRKAQSWLLQQVKDLKLDIYEDTVGNIFLRRIGNLESLPAVACGSHLDTVINGGAYDGACGVVGALEALYALRSEELKRSIEVIIFRAEESSRFGFGTIGSKLLTGAVLPQELLKDSRAKGISFLEALEQWGCDPTRYLEAIKPKDFYSAFVELHIEQGRVLEETGHSLGIVHNIAAPTRFKICVRGTADHSGATPMGFRHDALVTASRIVLAIEEHAKQEKGDGTVATVGMLDNEPGSINVVPGITTLWVDLRGTNSESIDRTLKRIIKSAQKYAKQDKLSVEFEMLMHDVPVALSEDLAARTETLCKKRKISFLHMNSGAGHDAMNMAKITPTTLLFIPCKEGISHNKDEYASIEHIVCGVEILADLLKQLANEN